MALQYKVGSFTEPVITGSKAVTGVGFQPKVLILYSADLTADGSVAGINWGFGFGLSSSSRAAMGFGNIDNTATVNSYDYAQSNAHIIYISNGTGSLQIAADLTSLDSDGFTLNFSTVSISQYVFNYIAIGGADLSNTFIKQLQCPAATGSQSYTGVGFKPDCIIAISQQSSSTPPVVGAQGNDPFPIIGFGTNSNSKSMGWAINDNGSTSLNGRVQKTDILVGTHRNTITMEASLTSLDSDGFTWNWSAVQSNAYVWVLCLKGGQYKINTFNQPASTGNQAITGTGFQTVGLILQSANAAASTSVTAGVRNSFGAGSSSSNRGCIWWGSADSVSTLNDSENLDRANIIRMMTESHASPTTQAAADLTSLDSDGFTINWSSADATAREIIYLAMGSVPVLSVNLGTSRLLMGVGI